MNKRNVQFYLLAFLVALVVLSMLYFGFRFKGFRPANNARWSQDGPGLYFGRYGIAFTEPLDLASMGEDLSFEMALRTEQIGGGVHFVMVVHNGDDAQQLLIGQWRSKLIVMHGDDYENRRKSPKITLDIGRPQEEPILLSITSGEKGTRIFLNGELKKENPGLRLRWPGAGQGARLILGNSAYGHHSWRGAVAGLAVYARDLAREQVDGHYKAWRENGNFAFAMPDTPAMLVYMDEGAGERAYDRSGHGHDLIIPAYMRILKKEVLVLPWHLGSWRDYYKDTLLNFIGFLPLGFLMAALLDRGRRTRKVHCRAALLACFIFSLAIEMGQVWIPSRTSSLLDLILNTSGAGIGIMLYAGRSRFKNLFANG